MQIENVGNNERIGYLIDYLGQTIKDGDSFVREQAPMLAREVVDMQLASSIFGVVCVATISAFVLRYSSKLLKSSDDETVFSGYMMRLMVVLVGGLLFGASIHSGLRCIIAPRMVVMNYVRSLK